MEVDMKKIADKVKRSFHLPSLSVAVYHHGKEYYYQTGKNAASQVVTPQTVYPIGSISKSFIATAIIQLEEVGLLSLCDPVSQYLPKFKLFRRADLSKLTIKDILCHCSGLPRHDISLYTSPQEELIETVKTVASLPPVWPLRSRFAYQNHLYAVATLLVERVSGLPWGEYLKQAIFDPLEMQSTYTKSQAYETESDFQLPKIGFSFFNLSTQNMNLDGVGGAGALSSTAEDLLTWARCHLNNGQLANQRILSTTSAETLHSQQIEIKQGQMNEYHFSEIEKTGYGLGWFTEVYKKEKLVHHGGALTGFKSEVGFIKGSDFAFAILTNRDGTIGPTALSYLLCDLFLEKNSTDWQQRFHAVTKKRKNQQVKRYKNATKSTKVSRNQQQAGNYQHPAYGNFKIVSINGRMKVKLLGLTVSLKQPRENTYVIDLPFLHLSFPCYFVYDDDGVASHFFVKFEKELTDYICLTKVKGEVSEQ